MYLYVYHVPINYQVSMFVSSHYNVLCETHSESTYMDFALCFIYLFTLGCFFSINHNCKTTSASFAFAISRHMYNVKHVRMY